LTVEPDCRNNFIYSNPISIFGNWISFDWPAEVVFEFMTAEFSDLRGKSVVITGGASGIGAALVKGFLKQKCKVAFIDIDDAAAAHLQNDVGPECSQDLQFIFADLSDVTLAQKAIKDAAEKLGALHVLINNAARDDRHSFDTATEADWDKNQAINLKQMFFVCQAALPHMRKAGSGSIINFSSIAFMLNMAELPVYATAKAGIIGLTKTLAGHAGVDNIRANAVLPGMIVTERQKQLWLTDASIEAFKQRQCLKWSLTAEDLVGPCLFLASDSSRAITAQSFIVDGGVF